MSTSLASSARVVVEEAAKSLDQHLAAYEVAKNHNAEVLQRALAEMRTFTTENRGNLEHAQMEIQKALESRTVSKEKLSEDADLAPLDEYRNRYRRPDVEAEDFFTQVEESKKGMKEAALSLQHALQLDPNASFL
ncbi:unnamed protein product [Amoebophrya sp. A120]|nr:unnamed protein product [Amoebophrya sp. A120]|eukprot:GSA120T00021369001.1